MRHSTLSPRIPIRHRRVVPGSTHRRGAAAVEMAIVTPLLLLFAFASADFGRVVHAYAIVSNAARCGTEYGSMHGFTPYTRESWESRIRQIVDEEMQGLSGFDKDQMTLTITTSTDADDLTRAAIEVTYPFHTVVDWVGLPSQVTLRHRVEMRRIQ